MVEACACEAENGDPCDGDSRKHREPRQQPDRQAAAFSQSAEECAGDPDQHVEGSQHESERVHRRKRRFAHEFRERHFAVGADRRKHQHVVAFGYEDDIGRGLVRLLEDVVADMNAFRVVELEFAALCARGLPAEDALKDRELLLAWRD